MKTVKLRKILKTKIRKVYSLSRYQSFLRTLPLSPPLMLYFGCSWIPRPTWKNPLVVFLNSIFHLKALAAVLNESQSKKKKIFTTFYVWFFKRKFIMLYSINWTNFIWQFHFVIAFTFWDNGQYVYCDYLFPIWWNYKFWN